MGCYLALLSSKGSLVISVQYGNDSPLPPQHAARPEINTSNLRFIYRTGIEFRYSFIQRVFSPPTYFRRKLEEATCLLKEENMLLLLEGGLSNFIFSLSNQVEWKKHAVHVAFFRKAK